MRSTELRAAGQRGASLVEAVVASALMGIGVVGGLTAWDTAALSASRAVRLAWAQCIVRSELDAITASPFDGSYGVPGPFSVDGGDGTVRVTVADVPRRSPDVEQQVTVRAYDPQSKGTVLAQATVLRAAALEGDRMMDFGVLDEIQRGCPQR